MKKTIDQDAKQFVQEMRKTMKNVEPTVPKNEGPNEKEMASAFAKGVELMKKDSQGIKSIAKIAGEV